MFVKNVLLYTVTSILTFTSLACSGTELPGNTIMKSEKPCYLSRFETSQAIIDTILKDVSKSYDQLGGEISRIELKATNVYVVSISQEERIDQLTYEVGVDNDCSINILNKELSAISPWEK